MNAVNEVSQDTEFYKGQLLSQANLAKAYLPPRAIPKTHVKEYAKAWEAAHKAAELLSRFDYNACIDIQGNCKDYAEGFIFGIDAFKGDNNSYELYDLYKKQDRCDWTEEPLSEKIRGLIALLIRRGHEKEGQYCTDYQFEHYSQWKSNAVELLKALHPVRPVSKSSCTIL